MSNGQHARKCAFAFMHALAQVLVVGAFTALSGSAVAQQAYPNKPIRFITPFPPGGSTTIVLRLVGQKLTEAWGQQVIIENRPGGNTIIGTESVAKSPPDGYTIMMVNATYVINALLVPNLPYDSFKDLAAVTTVYGNETILVLHPAVPANDLGEFIALAKSKPGQLNFGAGDHGGITHVRSELFNIMAGVKINAIPYKGTGPVMIDLVGGHVQMALVPPIAAIPHVKSGKLKAIAVTGDARLSALPQIPTFTEAGMRGFELKNWNGVLAPAATAKDIIDKIAGEIARIVVMPDIKEKLVSQGLDPLVSTPEQFATMMKADGARFAKVIKTANIKLEK